MRQLTTLAGRDIKNVSTDLKVLENLGLVGAEERESPRQRKRPVSTFDLLDVEVYL